MKMCQKAALCLSCKNKFRISINPVVSITEIKGIRCPIHSCNSSKISLHIGNNITYSIDDKNVTKGKASKQIIDRVHVELIRTGYQLVGFTGCTKFDEANFYNGNFVKKNTGIKRGVGLYVGNLYQGIPLEYAKRKGNLPVRIYVKNISKSMYPKKMDWGLMDVGDDESKRGLEMILMPSLFEQIVALPSLGIQDNTLVWKGWVNAPRDTYSYVEREKLKKQINMLRKEKTNMNNILRAIDIYTGCERVLTETEKVKLALTGTKYEEFLDLLEGLDMPIYKKKKAPPIPKVTYNRNKPPNKPLPKLPQKIILKNM